MENGRASKRRRLSLEPEESASDEDLHVQTPTVSRVQDGSAGSTRKSGKLVEASEDEEADEDNGQEEEGEEEEDQESNIRSSGRQRRKPKRYESDDGTTIILTPARTRPKRPGRTPTKLPAKQNQITPSTTPKSTRGGRRRRPTKKAHKDEGPGAGDEELNNGVLNSTGLEEEVTASENNLVIPVSPERTSPRVNGQALGEEKAEVEEEEEQEEEDEREEQGYWPHDISQHAKIKEITLKKLVGKRATRLIGLDEEYKKLHRVIEQTVMAGEGNSLLLIGARGTGKTALINSVLKEVAKENREHFHIIRLNGFLQTDDKTALREIWRQLGKEMETEEKNPIKNYADTLSTLLATLSHTSELASGEEAAVVAKSVIFILDEFNLFASHPRQTLLYNLFDIAQSRKAPIAVIGVTTKVDIAESLEKRVKSRFSHRYIHLGLAKTLQIFQDIYKGILQLQAEELYFDERAALSSAGQGCLSAWNSSIDTLFKSPAFTRHASRIYYTTKSIPEALTASYLPVAMLDEATPFLLGSAFAQDKALSPPDSKLYLLPSLPTLSLALLIVAARLDVILDSDVCNFNMAYDEYSSLAARARVSASASMGRAGISAKVWGKDVAKGAWEKLVELKLLMPTTALGGMGSLNSNDMMRCEVALEEIVGAVGEIDRGLEKWCREI